VIPLVLICWYSSIQLAATKQQQFTDSDKISKQHPAITSTKKERQQAIMKVTKNSDCTA